jgi:methionyl-tRNA synthetase
MINKYFGGSVPSESPSDNRLRIGDHDWPVIAGDVVGRVNDAMARFDLAGAVAATLALIRKVDGFINLTEPFKLAKDESKSDELGAILYQCVETVRIASLLLWPVMPKKMAELWEALGLQIDPSQGGLADLAAWGGIQPGTIVAKVALFPRMEQPDLIAEVGA